MLSVCEEIVALHEERVATVDNNLDALNDVRERLHSGLSGLRERHG